jgi:hypothetical protein
MRIKTVFLVWMTAGLLIVSSANAGIIKGVVTDTSLRIRGDGCFIAK